MKRIAAAAIVCLTLGACAESVDAGKVLRDGAAAMASLKTVTATLKFTKGSISFLSLTLVSANAKVRLPGDSETAYNLKQQDITIGIKVVISGGHVYLQVPFSSFREVFGPEAATIPDVAKLFDPATGLPAVIPAGTKATYVSTETVDGVSCYRVTADYQSEQIHSMLASLNSSGVVHARLWVGVGDHFIRKAVLDGAFGDGGKDASVEVDMKNFNGDVTITPPS